MIPDRSPLRSRGAVALALGLWVGLAGCSGSDGDGGTGPEPGPTLRDRALAAGLEPLPTEPIRPVDNPYHPPRVELGRLLFFDPILSGPMDVACSTCHLPRLGFSDGRQFPVGAGGDGLGPDRTLPEPSSGLREMERNSPPMTNAGLFGRMTPEPHVNGTMFWSGSAFGLEDQVLNPIANDKELRGNTYSKVVARDSVLARLRSVPGYVTRFADAFPDVAAAHGDDPERLVTAGTLRRALAAYLRELVTPDAPLDRFLKGDDGALTAQQKEGLDLFVGKADCTSCHTGPLLSDFTLRVLGAEQEGLGRDSTPGDDLGWGEHGGTPYSFRTPPLRQVTETAPYFHAGTAATLLEVVRFKNEGRSAYERVPDAALDPDVRPLGLTEAEMAALVAFMEALTDTRTLGEVLFQPPEGVPSGLEVPR